MKLLPLSLNWPKRQGLLLDQHVSFIFMRMFDKCWNNTLYSSNIYLSLESLDVNTKQDFLVSVLKSFIKFVIRLKRQNISRNYLSKNKIFILSELFSNSLKESYKDYEYLIPRLSQNNMLNKLFFHEIANSLERLCHYFIFGIPRPNSPNFSDEISHNKVSVIAENLVIHLSEYIAYMFITDLSKNALDYQKIYRISNKSIKKLQKRQRLFIIRFYIKYIFCQLRYFYRLWIFAESNITDINIYLDTESDQLSIANILLLINLISEIYYILIVSLQLLLLLIGKTLIYIFDGILRNYIATQYMFKV
nr:hypothetical protein CVCH_042 [Cavernulicola chilensis]